MIFLGDCDKLPASWTYLKTTAELPVNSGTTVKVQCEPGLNMFTGDAEIVCEYGEKFTYIKQPKCIIGMFDMNSYSLKMFFLHFDHIFF